MEKLLASKPYDAISVSELCKLSTVQRGTFYRHFEDKSDFFKYYLNTITERLLSEAAAEGEVLDDLERYAKTMHLRLIAFFEDHPPLRQEFAGRRRLPVHCGHGGSLKLRRESPSAPNGRRKTGVPPVRAARFPRAVLRRRHDPDFAVVAAGGLPAVKGRAGTPFEQHPSALLGKARGHGISRRAGAARKPPQPRVESAASLGTPDAGTGPPSSPQLRSRPSPAAPQPSPRPHPSQGRLSPKP